ncbi:MAG: hypothetical protein CMN04_10970 [Roseibacillus sp.]|nr:hypothetical protein [Roseibacillus sp.]|tara:strand:- start:7574 stop:9001 length:1428 start_codon:yes stop_codon:yes gene_type:complete
MIQKRRKFLKAGASLAMAPFLPSLQAQAQEQTAGRGGKPIRRFVFVVKSSGIDKFNLVPEGLENHYVSLEGRKLGNKARRLGPMVDVSLSEHALPAKLSRLEAFRDRLTIIQSLSGEGFSGNHTAGYGALSCHNSERVAIAPSIDCLLGKQLSMGPYPMYGMATNGRLLEGGALAESYCYPNISAYKAGMPVPFQASPRKAFVELFGASVAPPEELERELALNGSLMNFLTGDAKRIEKQLTGDEKERFGLYLNSFEELQNLERKKVALSERVKRFAPKPGGLYDSVKPKHRIESYFELAAASLITGLTNVITIRPDTLGVEYRELGISNSVHALGHLGENKATNGMNGNEARAAVERLHLDGIAEMAGKLDGIPEGDGTMLDHTLIVYMSCSGGDHHGGQADWPFLLVGGSSGRLRMGRYMEFPKYREEGHRTIGNLYLSFMKAAGMNPPVSFGQPDSNLKDLDLAGPLSELMA